MLEQAFGLLIDEVAVDLGSASLRIFVRGRGLVVEQPAIVAVQKKKGKDQIVAVGREAKQMMGRTPEDIHTIHPIQGSKIVHPALASKMLHHGLEMALGGRPLLRPRMIVSKPHGLDGKELKTFREVVRSVGGRDTHMVDSLICASLGCELPIDEPKGMMIIDIGCGGTRAGVLSLSNLCISESLPIAGHHFDQAIINWLREQFKVVIGERSAEELKNGIGCAANPDPERRAQFQARDINGGLPREVNISSVDIHKALQPPLQKLITAIQNTLHRLSAELAADLVDNGIVICGGGSLLSGMADFLQQQIKVPIINIDNPRHAIIDGAGYLLGDPPYLHWISQ